LVWKQTIWQPCWAWLLYQTQKKQFNIQEIDAATYVHTDTPAQSTLT
jgi:hypothetical protein